MSGGRAYDVDSDEILLAEAQAGVIWIAEEAMIMHEHAWKKKLSDEGFLHVYSWQDAPNAHYPDHTHPELTAHIILSGEMTVTCQGRTATYRAGDRFDVPANTVHAARIGAQGCRYIIGEKEP